MDVTMLRRVGRINATAAIFLPTRYVGKQLRLLITRGDGTSAEFVATCRRFGSSAYVAIPAAISDTYPPGTVVIAHIQEVE